MTYSNVPKAKNFLFTLTKRKGTVAVNANVFVITIIRNINYFSYMVLKAFPTSNFDTWIISDARNVEYDTKSKREMSKDALEQCCSLTIVPLILHYILHV